MVSLKNIYTIWYIFFKKRNTSDVAYLIQISTESSRNDFLMNKRTTFLKLVVLIKNSLKWIINSNVYYATNYKNFLGVDLYVNKHVLVPRFETELLVDETIKIIKTKNIPENIIDIGTGSGAIAISIKQNLPNADVAAIDISSRALMIAEKNAIINTININFELKNLFNFVSNHNVIISNPPYLYDKSEIDNIVLKTEPHLALFADNNGLDCYNAILNNYKNSKTRPLLFAFETGLNQGESIKLFAHKIFPKAEITIKKDLNNIDRFIFIFIK